MNVWPQCCHLIHIIKDGMASCGAVHLGHQLHVDGQAVAGIEGHSQCALEAW